MLLSVTIIPSLLQETVETGPPVEVQVRVNTGGSVAGSVFNWKVMSPGIVTCPVGGKEQQLRTAKNVTQLYCKLNSILVTTKHRDLYIQFANFVDSDRECTSFHTATCIRVTKSVISHIPYTEPRCSYMRCHCPRILVLAKMF